ncbi:AT-rich interactive domain-containing protein 5B [Biomphalaria glabrata]|nr:AT-rich interactive domain-containing protein 5B [Biomphalaria glabrata]
MRDTTDCLLQLLLSHTREEDGAVRHALGQHQPQANELFREEGGQAIQLDEVLALGDRLVLKLEDLVPLIQHDVKWTYGCSVGGFDHDKVSKDGGRSIKDSVHHYNSPKYGCDKMYDECKGRAGCGDLKNGVVKEENGQTKNCTVSIEKLDNTDFGSDERTVSGAANLAVLSYPKYCRYRAMRKRLEGCENEWLHLAIVVAIGGFSGRAPGCKVMFCKETFLHSELETLDIRMDHLMPILKSRPKNKKSKNVSRKDSQHDSDSMEEYIANVTPSISSSTRPRRSTESSEISEDKVSTEEQAFLIGLHKFMHDAKMPIGRIPSLGFKQIDLFYFYKQAEKLGGYDLITHKRMWKHLYDKLGGNMSNTSAATCTRKHYERLLLPYERHLRKVKSFKAKKKQTQQNDGDNNTCETKKMDSKVLEKEIVETSETKDVKTELKDEENISQTCVKEEIKIMTTQENVSSESNVNQDNIVSSIAPEHSKLDLQGETEVLEIPVIGHCIGGNSAFPALELNSLDGAKLQNLQHPHIDQQQQQQHQQASKSLGASQSTTLPGENPCLINANLMLRGGYLMPVINPHLLQSQWGIMTPSPSSSTSASSPQMKIETVFFPQAANTDPTVTPSSTKSNQNLGPDNFYNAGGGKLSQSHQQPPISGSSVVKTAHSNSPYKPSPYLLNDHIQAKHIPKKLSRLSHYGPNDLLGNSSQNLSPILHPKPPGHRAQSHLPPAPSTIYLHPTSTNPFSPLQSPITSPPPVAHKYPRKRAYPFENPTTSSGATFPSPDMVLDRIKNSTSLPGGAGVQAPIIKQQYDDPRLIFVQAPQPVAQSQSTLPHRKQPSSQPVPSSKPDHSKPKNSRKTQQQTYSHYGPLPPLELQQPYMQQIQHSNSKASDQMRSPNSINGLIQNQQSTSKSMPSTHQGSPAASSSKEGRLTSALFGTQFTAMPRTTKASDHPPQSPHMPDPTIAMSMNSHLHPAFMNLYMPTGAQAPVSNINPQLQLIANAYRATPAQMAAYEELVRQNGYTNFLPASQQQLKTQKKN